VEPALEDSSSPKRRRPAKRQAESLVSDPVCTPKLTPLPTSGSQIPPLRTSNGPNPGFPDSGSKGNGAETSDIPRNDLLDLENGGDGAHHGRAIDKELLHSLRQLISPSERIDSDQDVHLDSERGEDKSNGSDGKGESTEDELNRVNDVSRGTSAATQRHEPSNRPFRERRRGPS